MKKLKHFAVLAGSLFMLTSSLFVSCANDAGDDTPETPVQTNPGDDQGDKPKPGDDGDNTKPGDETKPGDDDGNNTTPGEEITDFVAPELGNYFKKYFFTTDNALPNFGCTKTTWDGNAVFADDDVSKVSSVDSMWGGDGGFALVYNGFAKGVLANYEYIVYTLDTSDFATSRMEVKIPDVQINISKNYKNNSDGTKSYFVKVADFASATTADQIALLAYGTGSTSIKEIYAAATEDPDAKAITGITISPDTAILLQNGTTQFTVKDSNFAVLTNDVTYILSGDAATGSTITDAGLLTVGTTAGDLIVTAKYTANGKDFTAQTTIKVLGELTNLLKTITHRGDSQVTVATNDDGTFTVTSNGAGGDWGAQAFFTLDDDCLSALTNGKNVFISVDVETATNVNAFMKLQVNNGYKGIDNNTAIPSLNAGEKRTVSITGTLSEVVNGEIVLLFDFRGTEAGKTITLSNFQVFDITE